MARVAIDREWQVSEVGTGLDAAIDRAIHDHGMTASRSANRIEMRGGSQMRLRLLGGWFVKDSALPKGGSLDRRPEANGAGVELIALHLEDKLGFGVMDPKLRQKYQRALESIALSISAAISANVDALSESGHIDPR